MDRQVTDPVLRAKQIEAIERWLDSKRTTLWVNWIITSKEGKRAAAQFVLDVCEDVGPLLRGVTP